jgi:hypothetical protein
MLEQREKKLKTYVDGGDLQQDDGDHGIMQGYVRRKGINDVSPILANLFSPSKRSLNLGSDSKRFLNKDNSGFMNGFSS